MVRYWYYRQKIGHDRASGRAAAVTIVKGFGADPARNDEFIDRWATELQSSKGFGARSSRFNASPARLILIMTSPGRKARDQLKSALHSLSCSGRRPDGILPRHFYSGIPDVHQLERTEHWRQAFPMVGVEGAVLNRNCVSSRTAAGRSCSVYGRRDTCACMP